MLRIQSICALAVLAFPVAASAADFSHLAQPVYSAPSGWAGPYVGLMGGFSRSEFNTFGWTGGVYGGFNVDASNNLVVGLEADASLTNKSGNSVGPKVQNPWDATLRARIGYGSLNWLLYGTAGVAFGSIKSTGAATETVTKTGWTVGAGIEGIISGNLTARVEYRYTDYGTVTFPTNPSAGFHSNDLLVGADLRFR